MTSTLDLVKEIFQCPTAPYREGFVLDTIQGILERNKIPYFFDNAGNLVAGWNGKKSTSKKLRIGFLAHTDHPGFHIKGQKGRRVEALWLGGAPFDQMKGVLVRIYSPLDKNFKVKGRILKLGKPLPHREGVPLTIELLKDVVLPKHAFGAFDFDGFKLRGGKIITRAADDLAGCVIQLGALLDTNVGTGIALFTRAEEVGFVGCLAAIKQGVLPKIPYVSLEASKELPGAKMGKGPVLRLGDRASLFDTCLSQALLTVAENLKKESKVLFQRRIMDGGTCEATALNVLGYRASGISVPLGHYHNQGKSRPAPEIISLEDVDRARKICAALIAGFSDDWSTVMKGRMKDLLKHGRTHLRLSTLKRFVRQSGQWPF